MVIHVENPEHDGDVRCFYRHRDGRVGRTIRRHISYELDADLERIFETNFYVPGV